MYRLRETKRKKILKKNMQKKKKNNLSNKCNVKGKCESYRTDPFYFIKTYTKRNIIK